MNNMHFDGNLVADCEVIDLDGDPNLIKFSVAHGERRYNKETGQYEDDAPTYIDCSLFDKSGKRTPYLREDLVKGAPVTVDGRIFQERWEKDGKNFSKLVCRVNDVRAGKQRQGQDNKSGRQQRQQRVERSVQATNPLPPAQIDGADAYDLDIPFGG